MTDKDGAFTYSSVVQIKAEKETARLRVTPTPATGHVYVDAPVTTNNAVNYFIADALGKTVKRGVIAQSNQKIDLQGLTEGTYYIFLSNGDSGKIIVQ